MHTFETPEPVRLKVTGTAGTVHVTAEDTSESRIELTVLSGGEQAQQTIDEATVTQDGDALVVAVPRTRRGLFGSNRVAIAISAVVPVGSSLRAQTDSADVSTRGPLDHVDVKTGSGEIQVDRAEVASVQSGSGDVEVDACTRQLIVKTGSGDVEVDQAADQNALATGSGDVEVSRVTGTLRAKTGSGDVLVRNTEGDVVAKTGSGDVAVRSASSGTIDATAASGEVQVGVLQGTAVWLDLDTVTGRVGSELDDVDQPESSDRRLELRAKTATGDIVVHRA